MVLGGGIFAEAGGGFEGGNGDGLRGVCGYPVLVVGGADGVEEVSVGAVDGCAEVVGGDFFGFEVDNGCASGFVGVVAGGVDEEVLIGEAYWSVEVVEACLDIGGEGHFVGVDYGDCGFAVVVVSAGVGDVESVVVEGDAFGFVADVAGVDE